MEEGRMRRSSRLGAMEEGRRRRAPWRRWRGGGDGGEEDKNEEVRRRRKPDGLYIPLLVAHIAKCATHKNLRGGAPSKMRH